MKVVKAVAQGIGYESNRYDITLPSKRKSPLIFTEKDILVVGVPVYAGRVPEFVSEYLATMKGNNTLAVFLAVYGNRDYDDALLELKELLESKGFVGLAAGAFIGEHSYTDKVAKNRPDWRDHIMAKNFGRLIKMKIRLIDKLNLLPELHVSGNTPYRPHNQSLPLSPVTNDNCLQCSICAESCPRGAIDIDDVSDVDAELCVKCHCCVKGCPMSAKEFDERLDRAKQWLEEGFSKERLKPELFF